jgi:anaerobic selenocysteine-containing dehydrogenase
MIASSTDTLRRFHRECPFCEATCGLLVIVEAEGRVSTVRGDPDHPLSAGYVCPKSQGLIGLREDPDRLRLPLIRRGADFEEVSWDEALDYAGENLRRIHGEFGADALGFYIGNPAGHSTGLMLGSFALLGVAASRQIYSACSVDVMPRFVANIFLYGNRGMTPIPDVDRTDFLLMLGANPLVSNGSMLTAPGFGLRLKRLRERGGRAVVIDPRRTETAERCDQHIPIRPGTDALLLLAMVHTLFEEGLVTLGLLDGMVDNIDELRTFAAEFTPDQVATVTGVDAKTIRTLTRDFAAAPSAVAYGRVGACCQAFGTLTTWLLDCLTLLTGNLDRAGGAIFPQGVISNIFADAGYDAEQAPYDRYRTRARGAPEVGGEFPTHALADEIRHDGPEGRLHALIVLAGNPARSNSDTTNLCDALGKLDFMVSVDLYLNETSRLANVILPGVDPLGRSDFSMLYAGASTERTAQYSPQIAERAETERNDYWIMIELATRLAGKSREDFEPEFEADFVNQARALPRFPSDVTPEKLLEACSARGGHDRLYEMLLRSGPFGDGFGRYPEGVTLDSLKRAASGIHVGTNEGGQLRSRIGTPSGTIDLTPHVITNDIQRLREEILTVDPAFPYLAIGRRDIRSNNSWMHNLRVLVKGPNRCVMLVHPDDAEALTLVTGDQARVISKTGELVIPVRIDDSIAPGVVSIPHGWGHRDTGSRLEIARSLIDANFNMLTSSDEYDIPSGNSILNGIKVSILAV